MHRKKANKGRGKKVSKKNCDDYLCTSSLLFSSFINLSGCSDYRWKLNYKVHSVFFMLRQSRIFPMNRAHKLFTVQRQSVELAGMRSRTMCCTNTSQQVGECHLPESFTVAHKTQTSMCHGMRLNAIKKGQTEPFCVPELNGKCSTSKIIIIFVFTPSLLVVHHSWL